MLVSDLVGTATVLTLPAAAEGLNYTVLVTIPVAHANGLLINTTSNAGLLGISVRAQADMADGNSDAGHQAGTDDRLAIPQGGAAGTKIDLWCDGTSWYAYALTEGVAPVYSNQQS